MSKPNFNEVEDAALRTWNRCCIAFNLANDKGPEESEKYMKQFDKISQMQMMNMFSYIKLKGYEEVKKEINKGTHSNILEA